MPCRRPLIGDVRRVDTDHEVPDLVPLIVFGLAPGRAEGLGGDLDVDVFVGAKVEVPVRMLVGAALRGDDDDFAADVAVDERDDACLSGSCGPAP